MKTKNNTNTATNTATGETFKNVPTLEGLKKDFIITLFPVAKKTGVDKKGNNKVAETFAPFARSTKGNGKFPLAVIADLENVPNGKRSEMIVWVYEFCRDNGCVAPDWLNNEVASARDKLRKSLENANKRTNDDIAKGVDEYVKKASDKARKNFETLPEKVETRNNRIEALKKIV